LQFWVAVIIGFSWMIFREQLQDFFYWQCFWHDYVVFEESYFTFVVARWSAIHYKIFYFDIDILFIRVFICVVDAGSIFLLSGPADSDGISYVLLFYVIIWSRFNYENDQYCFLSSYFVSKTWLILCAFFTEINFFFIFGKMQIFLQNYIIKDLVFPKWEITYFKLTITFNSYL